MRSTIGTRAMCEPHHGCASRWARTAAAALCAPSLRYPFAARLATVLIEIPSSAAMSLCVRSRPMRSRIRHSRAVSGRARVELGRTITHASVLSEGPVRLDRTMCAGAPVAKRGWGWRLRGSNYDPLVKRLTKTPWFGPRRLGWGWRPITWQGWATSLFFFVVMASLVAWNDQPDALPIPLLLVAIIFVLTCYLTGGRPGGPTLFDKRPTSHS